VPVSEETYKRVALEDGDETWELHCGRLVAKPPMSLWHNRLGFNLAVHLQARVARKGYEVRANAGRTRCTRLTTLCLIAS
jgi:Uma2 family endonuclease